MKKNSTIGVLVVLVIALGVWVAYMSVADKAPQKEVVHSADSMPAQPAQTSQGIKDPKVVVVGKEFTLSRFPGATFKIGNIYRTDGEIPSELCSRIVNGGSSEAPGTAPAGTMGNCSLGIPANMNATIKPAIPSLVAVDLQVKNLGTYDVSGNFISVSSDGAEASFASPFMQQRAYGTKARTTTYWTLAFKVPSTQNEFNIFYGDYNSSSQRDEGGFIVNFNTASYTEMKD